jgi:hypothetical protein
MSHSSTHALSTRLFVQAAVTALLAPLTKGGSTWLVLSLAVAAGAAAVAVALRGNPRNAKVGVIGFEVAAVAVGALGIAGGHYIPGTIIGVATLITALNMPAVTASSPDSQWVPLADAGAPVPAPVMAPPPAFIAPPLPAQAPAPEAEAAPEPAPIDAPLVPPPAAEVTQPLRPEDIPPAQRSLTILPGR